MIWDHGDRALNRCWLDFGYCSQCSDGYCGCPKGPESTGCAYADGNAIYNFEPIFLDCCKDGCVMKATEYMRWNGECSYAGSAITNKHVPRETLKGGDKQ